MENKLDLSYAIREAEYALSGAAADVGLHLAPALITRTAAKRMERALRVLEDFVRRILLALALQFEHEIEVDMSERPYPKKRRARRVGPRAPSFRILPVSGPPPDSLLNRIVEPKAPERGPVQTGPILARIDRLRALLDNTEARAHRYAYTLARRHHYAIFAPGPHRLHGRWGTVLTTQYHAIGARLFKQSRDNRPEPKGPRPRPPPRILFP